MIRPLGKLLHQTTRKMIPSADPDSRGSLYEFQLQPYNPMPPVPPKSLWQQFKRIVYFVEFLFKSVPLWLRVFSNWLFPKPPKIITNWNALVTGGANGIGSGVVLELAKCGCNVIIADLDEVNGERIVQELKKKYRIKAGFYRVDVSEYDEVVQLGRKIEHEFGPVDILVNNAGVLPFSVSDEYSPANLQRMMDVNILSHFWTVKTFLPGMYERRRGHVVGLSSRTAYVPTGYMRNYATSKYAVRGFMEELHDEIYHAGYEGEVVTTCVFPAVIATRKESIGTLLSLPGYSEMDVTTVEECGRQIVNAILRNKRKLFVPNTFQTWQLALFE
ncbi:uncharacterized oxidoreductase YoxD-like [Culex pipiens pallens]|uniref:uncharacterized oxidoreductase YoxD-like n=1 Tax=Culex pipiens pallens TaxID=42434 RepID=UPI001952B835|nr:uncharacterized oxidoreductase YoxD-like [Culex pipiens pallens]